MKNILIKSGERFLFDSRHELEFLIQDCQLMVQVRMPSVDEKVFIHVVRPDLDKMVDELKANKIKINGSVHHDKGVTYIEFF